MSDISTINEITQEQLLSKLGNLPTDKRNMVAIAAPPGAGKTTLTDWLVEEINESSQLKAQPLYLDGFHFDNILLTKMNLLKWKGAPNTFDVKGMENTLKRLNACPAEDVVVPVFDRSLEIARAGASIIPKDANLLIVEGNYILCDKSPWDSLNKFFDLRILIKTPKNVLKDRLRERWKYYGLDDESIRFKLYENDLPNGDFVMEHSRLVDYYLIQSQGD
ncbi:MAG: nucleoside/nucleotide kinase family protein [Paracoccaceae bacterium]|nr:nucleoside/nucleotide kinase family protein [Paracoccaceae bacterium]MDE2917403.1 nucleoside/nucleotide kinase family protein [Paracoccaceae bacterium]